MGEKEPGVWVWVIGNGQGNGFLSKRTWERNLRDEDNKSSFSSFGFEAQKCVTVF